MNDKEKLEEAKRLYKSANADQRYVLESLFPELAESEDERIRKVLLESFEYQIKESHPDKEWLCGVKLKEIVAWLEKQGEKKPIMNVPPREVILSIWDLGNEWKELTNGSISTEYSTQLDYIQKHWCESEYYLREKQGKQKLIDNLTPQEAMDIAVAKCFEQGDDKPNDKVEPKFNVGDWVVWDNKIYCHVDNIYQGKESLMYTITDAHNMTRSYSVKGFDNNARLWTIKDAKDGDVLYAKGSYFKEYLFMFSSFTEDNVISTHFGYDVFRGTFNTKLSRFGREEDFMSVTPATKNQCDTLMKAMADAGYTFDFEKKELKKMEKQGEKPQVDGFDAELNALLKKYEHLSKKELQEPLEFYLGIVRDDLDVVRENPTKHVGWVNIFKCGLCYSVWGNIYPTKEDALNEIEGDEGDVYITTIKIEWEEQQ